MGITDPSVYEELDITPEELTCLQAQIRRRLTPQPIKIRADIEVN
jgi:translation initiation factor 2 alpha subunit (eIF-2alpha)